MSEQAGKQGGTDQHGASGEPVARASAGAGMWFMWTVGLWVVFFVFLQSGRLEEVASTIKELPLPLELLVWLLFFPWVLGTAVWTSGWSETLRMALVVLFALGWTVLAIPRPRKPRPASPRRSAKAPQ